MNSSPPIIHRAQKKRTQKLQAGTVLSFTVLAHPPARFGKRPRQIGLIELEDGKKVLAPLLAERPFIGQRVHARMRLSHVTEEKLRVYEVSYEALSEVPAIMEKTFPGYILALTGPSGVGKTTVSRLLVQMFSDVAVNVPIVTTRKEKPGDEGEYLYASTMEFEEWKRAGLLVAATDIPSRSENRRYGYRRADFEAIWKEGKLPVVIREMHLLNDLANTFGRRSILSFGLLPPGKSKRAKLSQLLHRLRKRGRETEAHIQDRLKNAEKDLAFFEERSDLFDHVVVNKDLNVVIRSLQKRVPGLSEA